MQSILKQHSNNNFFDIVKFNIKNGINKDKELILTNYSQMIMTTINKNELNEIKIAIYFILLKIIELFNIYLKSIHYSIELINENPNNTNEDYLINMDNKFFNINDDEINIYHHNIIKTIIIIVTSNKTAVIPNLSYQILICFPNKFFFAMIITIKSINITAVVI